MPATLSSLEDVSSILYEGRAKISHLEDIVAMADSDWKTRLQAAVDKSGRSAREVSLKSGKGPGYLHSILKEGKDPTVDSLVAVCSTLNVSVSSILLGVEMSRETEEILKAVEGSPARRDAVLRLLDQQDRR